MAASDHGQDASLIGTSVAHFQIVRRLSAGGMGTVYEGIDKTSQHRVAIKVLHQDIAQHRDVTLRFVNEARALNIVHHQNLVRVIHLGKLHESTPYLVMEYLDGVSLGTRLRENEGPLPIRSAIQICLQAASALTATHEKGIIHRDIKPDNIMVMANADGTPAVKVFDFGIAKLPPEHMSTELTFLRTQSGQLLGTPFYMAPEQCTADAQITDKVDVYALGTVLFRCLAGRTPFISAARGDAAMMHVCAQQIADPPPLLSEFLPTAPSALVALLDRALAKDPKLRPSMRELQQQLKRLLESDAQRAPEPQGLLEQAASLERKKFGPSGSVDRLHKAPRSRLRWPYIFSAVLALWFGVLLLWALLQ